MDKTLSVYRLHGRSLRACSPSPEKTKESTVREEELKGGKRIDWLMAMDVGMSLNAAIRLPTSSLRLPEEGLVKHSLLSSSQTSLSPKQMRRNQRLLVVEAKKRGMQARQFQRPPLPPPLPKIEDDGNPRFVIFIRMSNVSALHFFYFDSVLLCPVWLLRNLRL